MRIQSSKGGRPEALAAEQLLDRFEDDLRRLGEIGDQRRHGLRGVRLVRADHTSRSPS
jgi:hypothetical protein